MVLVGRAGVRVWGALNGGSLQTNKSMLQSSAVEAGVLLVSGAEKYP
jgi:hypothetical protein